MYVQKTRFLVSCVQNKLSKKDAFVFDRSVCRKAQNLTNNKRILIAT